MILKCGSCNGPLEAPDGSKSVTCQFCGNVTVLKPKEKAPPVTQTVNQTVQVIEAEGLEEKTKAKVRNGYIYLEQGEFAKAKASFNDALEMQADCAEAYFGQFLAGHKCKDEADAAKCVRNSLNMEDDKDALATALFLQSGSPLLHKALMYALEPLLSRIAAVQNALRAEVETVKIEASKKKETHYHLALSFEKKAVEQAEEKDYANAEAAYRLAEEYFKNAGDYKDSAQRAVACATQQVDCAKLAQKARAKKKRRNRLAVYAGILAVIVLVATVLKVADPKKPIKDLRQSFINVQQQYKMAYDRVDEIETSTSSEGKHYYIPLSSSEYGFELINYSPDEKCFYTIFNYPKDEKMVVQIIGVFFYHFDGAKKDAAEYYRDAVEFWNGYEPGGPDYEIIISDYRIYLHHFESASSSNNNTFCYVKPV